MLIYLNKAYERRVREGRMTTIHDLREAIIEGAVQRVRPKMMTVAAIMGGLLPIMWTTGTGADVMKRIAAPMIGGMVSSTILTLLVIPVLYALWHGWSMPIGTPSLLTDADLALQEQERICISERQKHVKRGEQNIRHIESADGVSYIEGFQPCVRGRRFVRPRTRIAHG